VRGVVAADYVSYAGNYVLIAVELKTEKDITPAIFHVSPPSSAAQNAGIFSETQPIHIPSASAGLYFLEENGVLTPLGSGISSDLEARVEALEAWMAEAESAAGAANGGA